MTNTVTEAAAAVDYDAWVHTDNGETVPQSSAPAIIQRMVELLDLRPGMTVLEIGTGSGYSGALLAALVGPRGHVVSVDVDQQLVQRAARLHERTGNQHVEVHATDGAAGWPAAAPYDRIVGWTTPHLLPRAWVKQLVNDGVVVTPVKVAPVANANAVLHCHVVDGQPRGGSMHPGSFIEMAPEVVTDFGTPMRYINGVRRGATAEDPPTWASVARLHGQSQTVVEHLFDQLQDVRVEEGLIDAVERADLVAYLLAVSDSPASAGTSHGWGLGVGTSDSIALLTPRGTLLVAGTSEARRELLTRHAEWLRVGKPGYHDLQPTFARDDDGWSVQLECLAA